MDISEELEFKLQRFSNKCIRYIFGFPRDADITQRCSLIWLLILDRRCHFALTILYKAYKLKLSTYIGQLFERDSRTRRKRLGMGSNFTFKVPCAKTNMYKNSLQYKKQKLLLLILFFRNSKVVEYIT